MRAPDFSIVVPSWNQGPWLPEAIGSIRTAARTANLPAEIHVVDGGSTDSTPGFLNAQNDIDWVSEPDQGQTDAINKGLRKARGRILAYLCADDFYEPDAFQRASRAFDAHPTADFVYGDGYFLEGDSGWKRRKNAGPFTWKRLLRGNFLIQPAVFIRAESMRRFGEFDATLRFCMDHEYWLRAGAHAQWIYVNEPLATSRLHAGAKTSRALAEAWWEAAHMQARHGIFWRPHLQALWMGVAGHHLYRLRRMAYRKLGQHTAARSRA
jgi:glycosyltransferase involved in cell wall biosynthesis